MGMGDGSDMLAPHNDHMSARKVPVILHEEAGGWWAESPGMPGFSATGATRDEVRDLVADGAAFHFGEEVVEVEELTAAWE